MTGQVVAAIVFVYAGIGFLATLLWLDGWYEKRLARAKAARYAVILPTYHAPN